MAVQAGELLFERRRLTLPGNALTVVVTNIQVTDRNFDPDPGLGDATGSVVSRLMVIPLAPVGIEWIQAAGIVEVLNEPRLNPTTNTLEVTFRNTNAGDLTFNVLFWLPHTHAAPLSAEFYRAF